ncbi:hypothetical protein GA0115240_152213 [Streptomyces sp. DvalAA-14]|uniref:hypothetical protein n=1 Tax=unclassified Streptomyces TaxID=2593676 RepID=UPI00081B556A|nr:MULTISPECIES: hypothetical protein [unclassified Streptomyces]MYS23344.1 hypothetical protein [Streptomyces sp. SID4948]SCE31932.1 hypothetical protein GA0115240_152213 [Streptomyces sp. DvalAA-14]
MIDPIGPAAEAAADAKAAADLAAVFGRDRAAGDALVEWARDGGHGGTVRPVSPRWLPLAASGTDALLGAVTVTPGPGDVVVKVCPPELRREATAHARAERTAAGKVAKQAFAPWPLADGRLLTFQTPAGGSLRSVVALAQLRSQELSAACTCVVTWLLTGWNQGMENAEAVPVAASRLLAGELDALVAAGGSVLAYGDRVRAPGPDADWIEVDGAVLPNPLAMVAGRPGLPDPEVLVVRGHAHGDLHLDNVLVPRRKGRPQPDAFQLIDLTTYTADAPLGRDVAMLLLSVVADWLRQGLPPGQELALLRYLVAPSEEDRDRIVPELLELVDAVLDTCAGLVKDGWRDIWNNQFLLCLQAAALRFTTYDDSGDKGRWWYFRLAAHAGAELLERYGHRPPAAGVAFTAPQPGELATADTAEAGARELDRLRRLGAQAVADAGLLMPPNALFPRGITLSELHVPRELEAVVLRRVPERCAQLVVGEPGYGKTTLLWSLYRTLAAQDGVEPLFVKASFLLDAQRPEPLPSTAVKVPDVAAALARCGDAGTIPVLLVDTLDLLMHSPDGAALVARLIETARGAKASVVMSCRPGEAGLLPLEDADPGETGAGDAYMRSALRLGAYSDGERAKAVAGHSGVYCRRAVDGPGAAQALEARIMGAVYQDLPLREVCDSPLTLRLLFDVYTPDPPVRDIDVASLYDRVRRRRVEQDARAEQEDPPAGSPAARDLRPVAQALARYMLAANELEMDLPAAEHHLEELLPDRSWKSVLGDLRELERRGVTATIPGTTRVRFFHQTFFEYMAADWLRTSGRGGELIERILAHPTDLVLAAVAGQLVPREAPGRADELLLPLLRDDRTEALGLELYAQLRAPGPAVGPARDRLRTLSAEPVKRFLVVLPGRRHRDARRWTEDLTEVWRRGAEADPGERPVRVQLLESLCRLAHHDPSAALHLSDDLDCVGWLLTWLPQDLRAHDHLYLRILRVLFRHDVTWALDRMERFWALFSAARVHAGLADLVRAASEEAARIDDPVAAARARSLAAARFGALLDKRGSGRDKKLVPLEHAFGSLWASTLTGCPPERRLSLVLGAVSGATDSPAALARLYGAGVLAGTLEQGPAEQVVESLFALALPGPQSAALDMVVVPVMAGAYENEGRAADPDASPFARLLDTACREALGRLPAPAYEDGRRTRPAWFLEGVVRARPQAGRLLALLPDDSGPEAWLSADGLARLTVAAVAAGHPGARQALHRWANDGPTHAATEKRVQGSFRDAFFDHLADHPEMLEYFAEEAVLTEETDFLVAALEAAAACGHVLPPSHDAGLRGLADRLVSGAAERRRQGYRLIRAMIDRTGWPAPRIADVVDELRAGPGYPLRIALLELVRSAIIADRWSMVDAGPLVEILSDLADTPRSADAAGPAAEKAEDSSAFARSVLTVALCRLSAVEDPAGRRATADLLVPLVVPATADEGPLVTEDIRELGRLIERTALVDPPDAARLVLRISRALHAYDPRVLKPKREIANRWGAPLRTLLERLGPTGRRDLMTDLVTADVAIARRAVEVFAQLLESSLSDPPAWFQELAQRQDIHSVLRQSVGNRLRIHARTRCGGPWPELLAHGGAAVLPSAGSAGG